MTKLMSLALVLGLAFFSACGGNHNPAGSSPPETLPTPPASVALASNQIQVVASTTTFGGAAWNIKVPKAGKVVFEFTFTPLPPTSDAELAVYRSDKDLFCPVDLTPCQGTLAASKAGESPKHAEWQSVGGNETFYCFARGIVGTATGNATITLYPD